MLRRRRHTSSGFTTCATSSPSTNLRRGGNIYDVQKILGHSSIKTTELNLNYLDPEEQKIATFGPGFQPVAARSA